MKGYCFLCCLFVLLSAPAFAQEPGASVLVYNLYSSNATMSFAENTRLTVTNTSETASVAVHLFFIANDCKIADQFVSLTASQTLSFLASDVDPGVRGYIIAVAVDTRTGCPIKYNFLIGEAAIKLLSGHHALLPAEGIKALRNNPAGCNETANAAEFKFDGLRYEVLPRVLAISTFLSIYDGNQSLLFINRIGGDLRTQAATTGTLFGLLYDDAEGAYSFNIPGACQASRNIFAGTFPRQNILQFAIPSGRTGWGKVYNNLQAIPLLGAALNFNPFNSPPNFTGGQNMHHLTSTDAGTLTIPVTLPNG